MTTSYDEELPVKHYHQELLERGWKVGLGVPASAGGARPIAENRLKAGLQTAYEMARMPFSNQLLGIAACLLLSISASASFVLVDGSETETLGNLDGQHGWSAMGAAVVADPDKAANPPAISGILVATNSLWAMKKGTAEASAPTNAWRAAGFDDSTWINTQAPFYYGTRYTGNSPLNDMRNGYLCVYLRRPFMMTNSTAFGGLLLKAFCDDGFVAWINGKEVVRYNVQAARYAYTNTATVSINTTAYTNFIITNLASFLVDGANLLAIQAFNQSANSSDFVFDAELSSMVMDTVPPAIQSVNPPAGQLTTLSQITVTFSEPVKNVAWDDLLVNGVPATAVTGLGAVYTFSFAQPPYGLVQISWDPGNGISDFGIIPNRFNGAASGSTWQYNLVDVQPPVLASVNPWPGAIVRHLTQFEVRFSEPVQGVGRDDFMVNGGPATNLVAMTAERYLFQFPEPATGSVQIAWSPGHGITDLAAVPNSFAGGSWLVSLDPNAVLGDIVINEILAHAVNPNGYQDEDGEVGGWIELYNQGTAAANLRGWSLTDSPDAPDRWLFPELVLQPGQYYVVFASGKDRTNLLGGQRLHTSFKLNPYGEYLGLFNNESPRQAVSELRPNYPEQRNDYAYGRNALNQWRYYLNGTPGAANGSSAITGVVEPVHFSVARGLFRSPFVLSLHTATPDSAIRYTTDGSEPTLVHGTTYAQSLTLASSTTLRAAAFKTNLLASSTMTHTYLFPDQVMRQPNEPPGFPAGPTVMGGYPSDYEMDPEIVDDPQYRDLMLPALTTLPTLSIVMNVDDLFGPTRGIYTHTEPNVNQRYLWERPCSAELILTNGDTAFQVNCGIRIQGNASRTPQKTPKHPFRLMFRGDYGAGQLNYPVFPDSPVTSFETLVLRADFNDSWLHWDSGQRTLGQRTRDAWSKDSMRAMGSWAGHSRYLHLYLNGIYWGVYDFGERVDADFAASYLGGTSDEYDAIASKPTEAINGDSNAYNAMLAIGNLADLNQYNLLGQYLDISQFIDYTILHFYGANQDWGVDGNWNAVRRRRAGAGFKYTPWDCERLLENPNHNRVSNADVPSGLHTKLLANFEYRLAFADHVRKHFFNGGAMTTHAVAERWMKRATEVDRAIIAESARWGDYRRDVHSYSSGPYELYTRNNQWLAEQQRLLTSYFPVRQDIFLQQLRNAGLYPNLNAPNYSQHGGRVPAGYPLVITQGSATGTIYYTTNGVDPRVYGSGGIASAAAAYAGPVILHGSAVVKARVYDAVQGWSALNEASFAVAELGTPIRMTELMYNPADGSTYEFMELQNVGRSALDVGGAYFTGIEYVFPPDTRLQPGEVVLLIPDLNLAAFAARYPGVKVFGVYQGGLNNKGERISLFDRSQQMLTSMEYGDGGCWPVEADGAGRSLEVIDPQGDPNDPANWRASLNLGGSPGAANPPAPEPLVRLNELMAENVSAVSNAWGYSDWVELRNPGAQAVNLSGWSLSDDGNPSKYVFPEPTSIEPGGYLVVWFDSVTNAPGLHAGFALSRQGECVRLFDALTNRVDAVSYGAQLPDYSYGRVGVGGDAWQLSVPTPGRDNQPAVMAPATSLVVNEWMANSAPGLEDWLELYNQSGDAPAALLNLYLGTSNALYQIKCPAFIPPHGHLRLWADERAGGDHLGFKLPAAGGIIELFDDTGLLVSQVFYGPQAEGVSQGRLPDGGGLLAAFAQSASPGAANYLPNYTGPVLHEVMANNLGAVKDAAGRSPDWIELFNPSDAPFDLSGMSLSEGEPQLRQWVFPPGTTVAGRGYLVVWFDAARSASGALEADLNAGRSLSKESGGVYLFDLAGQRVDSLEYGFQVANLSIGLYNGRWRLLTSPSPGAANALPVAAGAIDPLRFNEWMVSGNTNADWFELYNPGDAPVELTGLFLTDDPALTGRTKFQVAPLSFIAGKGWVKWVADGDPSRGKNHVNFRLDQAGETLRLGSQDGSIIDGIDFASQQPGVSEGRWPDGAASIRRFPTTPTPGSANQIDSDLDGLPDAWELAYGLNPQDPADARLDADGDGFTNLQEYLNGTDPRVSQNPAILPPVILSENCRMTTNGFQLQISGQPGRRIAILATEDFVGWLELGTTGLVEALGTFVDGEAVGKSNRFYQLRETAP